MDKILKYATYIGEHEKTIKMLNSQREAFEQALAKMQGKQRPSSKCKIRAAECWGEGNALKLAILRIIVVTTHDPDDQTTSTGKQRPSSKCKIRAAECWGEGNALKLAILQIIVVTTHDPDDQTTGTETDGGFYPTQSKTGLRHHHPYTIALKNFGSKNSEKERDVHVAIYKDGKKLSLQQMEKQYQEWILDMHNIYDEESDCGEDEPVIIINPSNRKQLGISSDGESRIICRQIGTSEEKGCLLIDNENGNPSIDIRESKSLPINIIDSGKCLFVESAEWSLQLEKLQHKIPSSIDILCARHCEKLEVEELYALPLLIVHWCLKIWIRSILHRQTLIHKVQNLDSGLVLVSPQFRLHAMISLETALHFLHIPKVIAKVLSKEIVLFQSEKLNPDISSKNSVLTVENLLVESHNLDFIRPSYEAKLILYSEDEPFCVIIPCQVIPGSIHHLIAKPKDFMKQLVPGNVIQDLELEVFDVYGNHVKQDTEMLLDMVGFCFQHKTKRIQVDNRGCIDLSGLLKDSTGYAETVSLSVLSNEKIVFSEKSQTDKRMIRVAIEIPEKCFAGSQLENVVFEIVKSNGVIDETINDNEKGDMSHALVLKSDSTDIDDSVKN
ncbi:structural maintenance of chromosomes flexible hinge domain-containing protein GMI1-like isoform X2 [Daucus carota subsp. sativus]|uniref:structural maintenance of chromosomes flexible hinge domain-containing protein GMI1-like isoform X2 n=1 Tax=Daucus carota subsp. sativus TaxID=79200 RepID=UPI003083B944